MNERPILFSGPMVRAILDGRKTQTRRVVKIDTSDRFHGFYPDHRSVKVAGGSYAGIAETGLVWRPFAGSGIVEATPKELGDWCPYGKPGDRLWVRESFQPLFDEKLGADPLPGEYDYKTGRGYCVSYPATDGVQEFHDMGSDQSFCARITPSIHMPRWASRITLEITEVRVQRLQEISAEDCLSEGVAQTEFWTPKELDGKPFEEKWWDDWHFSNHYPQIAFRRLWESVNGAGSWDANPWVWAITFKPVEQESAAEKRRAL